MAASTFGFGTRTRAVVGRNIHCVRSNIDSRGDEAAQSNAQSITPFRSKEFYSNSFPLQLG